MANGLPFSAGFKPKMARRYGHADAACMAGKFIGVLTRFMDDHYADKKQSAKPIPKRRKVQEVMQPANRLSEGFLYAEEMHLL